ncbi:class I poly(R)-hydroxyalkanoic acid synthase [Pistricoccus aurantiacus]|uniref:class I poly(R)-hydroxyalkanoic acid synthase n=1 Tax=Pistricoccus aurantiacus TaxID=1883414 RepID=UPI00363ED9C4
MRSGVTPPSLSDIEEWNERLQAIGKEYQELMHQLSGRRESSEIARTVNDNVNETLRAGAQALWTDPQALHQAQLRLLQDQFALWRQNVNFNGTGGEESEPVIAPAKGDRRFRDQAWQNEPVYRHVRDQYLLFSRLINDVVAHMDGLSEEQQQNLGFYARQYVNALSPSNFFNTNPEVMRLTLENKGQNLIEGLARLREDLDNSVEGINMAMTDRSAFEVGRNIAVTPGAVVYENELMQLIQYTPSTDKTFKTPLLIIPPWINKYYILDLRQDNSLVKWLVDQGHTVFLTSWCNPGPQQGDITWADYMQLGSIAAMDAIEQATGEKSVNLLSYCVGGTLAATTVAYLTSTRRANRVRSVTYMTTLQDFSDPGEIGVFAREPFISSLERQMEKDGYLDGRVMAFAFNLLRENDLYWSFYINNYLKGEKPAPFDLLYWNTDSTNLVGATHGWYLRHMYRENLLVEPGGIELDGVKIDLRKISTPSYFLSTKEDHIAKWNSTYGGTQLPKGPVTFVLGGSGHIAGVVNPPHKNKYGYWTNEALPPSHEEWLEGATYHDGSWWPHWQAWLTDNGYVNVSDQVTARQPGEGKLVIIEPAPGRYVRQTIAEVLSEAAIETQKAS